MPKRNTTVAVIETSVAALVFATQGLLWVTIANAITRNETDPSLSMTAKVAFSALGPALLAGSLAQTLAFCRNGHTAKAHPLLNGMHFSLAFCVGVGSTTLTASTYSATAEKLDVLALSKEEADYALICMTVGYMMLMAKNILGSCANATSNWKDRKGHYDNAGATTMGITHAIASIANLFIIGVLTGVLVNQQNGFTNQTIEVQHKTVTHLIPVWWIPPAITRWTTTQPNYNMANSAGLAGAFYLLAALASACAAFCAKPRSTTNPDQNRPRAESEINLRTRSVSGQGGNNASVGDGNLFNYGAMDSDSGEEQGGAYSRNP